MTCAAKRLGRRAALRDDWDAIRIAAMHEVRAGPRSWVLRCSSTPRRALWPGCSANPFRARKRLGFSGSGLALLMLEAEPSRPLTRRGGGPIASRRTLSARGRGWGSAAPGGASMLPGQGLRDLLRGAAAARSRAGEPFPRAEEVGVQRLRAALRCCRGRAFATSYAARRRPDREPANPFRARKRLGRRLRAGAFDAGGQGFRGLFRGAATARARACEPFPRRGSVVPALPTAPPSEHLTRASNNFVMAFRSPRLC